MAYQVKKSYLRIITVIIGFISYGLYILQNTDTRTFTLSELGKYIFLIVPVLIVFEIIGSIIFDIFNNTNKKKERPKRMDEFDRHIEYKSVRNFMISFLIGLFTSFLLMWLSVSIFSIFIVLFITFHISGIILQLSYIRYYNHGV